MEWHNKGAILFLWLFFFLLKYWLQSHLNTSDEELSFFEYLGWCTWRWFAVNWSELMLIKLYSWLFQILCQGGWFRLLGCDGLIETQKYFWLYFCALDPRLLRRMKQLIFHICVLVSCSFLLNEAHNTGRNYFRVAGLVEAICGY